MKLAGKPTVILTRATVTFLSSKGCRMTSKNKITGQFII